MCFDSLQSYCILSNYNGARFSLVTELTSRSAKILEIPTTTLRRSVEPCSSGLKGSLVLKPTRLKGFRGPSG